MPVMPFVSVVMPAHNEEKYISECLTALKNQDYPTDRFEIIVVDNNSKDRTSEIAQSFGVKVLFKEKGPVGAVRNYGVTEAKGEIIGFIDSDCVAPQSWIRDGVQLIESNPNHAFGGGYNLREEPYFIEKYWLLSNNNEATLPNHLLGGTIFVKKQDFIQAGSFDTSITSGEDSKLTNTLRDSGTSVLFSQKLSVIHLGNPITVSAFFTRQIWHSENYFRDVRASLTDPIFYLVLLFYILLAASFVSILSLHVLLGFELISLALFLPMALSVKRISRAKYKLRQYSDIFYIYWLDLLYVVARCAGLTKSLFLNNK